MNSDLLIPYRKKDKWGFCSSDKKIVIDCIYSKTNRFKNSFAVIARNGKYGLIDKNGKEVVVCNYNEIYDVSESFVAVRLNDKWGFINIENKETIPFKYNWVQSFSSGLAFVNLNGLCGFVDKDGEEAIPCQYNHVRSHQFFGNVAIVELNKKYTLINKEGNLITSKQYDNIYDFGEDFAIVKLNEKEGLIDKTGKEMVPCKYSYIETLNKYFAETYVDNNHLFLDITTGKEFSFSYEDHTSMHPDSFPEDWDNEKIQEFILCYENKYPPKRGILESEYGGTLFENLGKFNEGMAWIRSGNLYGFIDEKYEITIPCKYYNAGNFHEGFAYVSNKKVKEIYKDASDGDVEDIVLEGNYGFIDKAGKEAISFKYHLASDFEEGLAKIEINGVAGYINKNGEEYWED